MRAFSDGHVIQKSHGNSRYYWVFTLFFLFFGGLVAAVTSLVNYNIQYTNIEKEIARKFEVQKTLKYELLDNFLQNTQSIVAALAASKFTHEYLKTAQTQARDNLNQILLTTTAANRSFLQLRYLDASGNEIVRIERDKSTAQAIIVPEAKLQNKKNRYYFTDASQLSEGQFWHSNFDLNMEHGQIEMPIQPTFRIATPVFYDNKFAGIVIVNMSINALLSKLSSSNDFEIYIVDKKGEFITHPEQQKSWSRYLPDRENVVTQFPTYGKTILTLNNIQQNDLYTFPLASKLRNQEDAIVILVPRQTLLQQLKKSNQLTAAIIALTVLLVSFVLSWIVAIIPARLQANLNNAFNKIKNYADIINRFVITSSTDANGVILKVSAALSDVSGYSPDEMIGKNNNMIRHPNTPIELYQDMWPTILQGNTWRGEIQERAKDGRSFWLQHIITPDIDENDAIIGFTSISHDITDKKEIERLSITDGLTKLFNRRRLDEVIQSELDRFSRYKQTFSVVLLDLDNFKQVNDNFGHKIGDLVLIKVANILSLNVRKTDLAGRWGGEEFMIICANTSLSGAMKLADNIRVSIEVEDFPDVGSLTASFGVTQCYQGDSADDIFLRTDKALYLAKENGRNSIEMAIPDVN